jgi:hypothetical protein
MNIFLTENPTVIIKIGSYEHDPRVAVQNVASNIAKDLNVVLVVTDAEFEAARAGLPFVANKQ